MRDPRTVLVPALVTLGATAAHHLYGGLVYGTPWRTHGAAVAVVVALVLAASARVDHRLARAAFAAVVLAIPIASIGVFEGTYNHVLKNVLFFGGASPALLVRMFPPPTYELPNDVLFEVSGMLQVVPAAWTAVALLRVLRAPRSRRREPGEVLDERWLVDVAMQAVRVPDPGRIVHLQLRRFAGCPVCNLHLRSFVRRHAELEAVGIREVVVFHSPAEELCAHAGGLPFAVVADPQKKLYAALGAESSVRAVLDPRAWASIAVAIARSVVAIASGRERPPALVPHGGRFGLPADFLVASDGRILACRYGAHVDDAWSVDEVLALVHPFGRHALAAPGS